MVFLLLSTPFLLRVLWTRHARQDAVTRRGSDSNYKLWVVTNATSHTSHMARVKMKLHKWAKLPIKEI